MPGRAWSSAFCSGDVTSGPTDIIHAAAHGRRAAWSIHAYLRKLPPGSVTELPDDEFQTASTLPQNSKITLDLRPTPRAVMPLRKRDAASSRSLEFALGLSEEQARREASRCLRCDLAYLCPSIRVISDSPGKQESSLAHASMKGASTQGQ